MQTSSSKRYEKGARSTLIENTGHCGPQPGEVVTGGSRQCPYYVHTALVKLSIFPREDSHYSTETGGGLAARRNLLRESRTRALLA